MFTRIQSYELIEVSGRSYRPRAYGDPQLDGTWDGWLVFFPVVGGGSAVTSGRETTQSTPEALTTWAAGLTPVYLDGALARALRLAHQPSLLDRPGDAEDEALEDAERLETAAEVERVAADVDEMAAAEARADAARIRRQRLATEGVLAATEAAEAAKAAEVHEEAARQARTVAADAARRSRRADTARVTRSKRRSGKKK